jgi:hypothetical protein
MSVILNLHGFGLFCTLGDGTLVAPYYPGQYERDGYVPVGSGNHAAYADYPTTTPDNICRIIRNGSHGNNLSVSNQGSTANGVVTAGFPASPISGSPFTYASPRGDRGTIYPRWTGETAWDLKAFAATAAFTPQGIATTDIFYPFGNAPFNSMANDGFSYETGIMANDATVGGDSSYDQEADWEVLVYSDKVCCWNDGAQIELNLDVWKIDFTAIPQPFNAGYFDVTTGSSSYHTTMTQTVTVDPSWETPAGGFVSVHTFKLPKVVGHFTFVNDFYVSSVTAP